MADLPAIPHRRHRMVLHLEADDIGELENALTQIGTRLIMDDMRGRDWAEPVGITSGGYHSGHTLTMTSDLSVNGDTYRASLTEWRDLVRSKQETPHD